jgi:hypothetical protein
MLNLSIKCLSICLAGIVIVIVIINESHALYIYLVVSMHPSSVACQLAAGSDYNFQSA